MFITKSFSDLRILLPVPKKEVLPGLAKKPKNNVSHFDSVAHIMARLMPSDEPKAKSDLDEALRVEKRFAVRHKPHCSKGIFPRADVQNGLAGIRYYHICPECGAGRAWGGPRTLGLYGANVLGSNDAQCAFPVSTIDSRVNFYINKK